MGACNNPLRRTDRTWNELVQYGHPSNRMDEGKQLLTEMGDALWQVYTLVRKELKEPEAAA